MAIINNVPSSDLPTQLVTWLNQAYVILFSIQESGTTAQRPTSVAHPRARGLIFGQIFSFLT